MGRSEMPRGKGWSCPLTPWDNALASVIKADGKFSATALSLLSPILLRRAKIISRGQVLFWLMTWDSHAGPPKLKYSHKQPARIIGPFIQPPPKQESCHRVTPRTLNQFDNPSSLLGIFL